MAEFPDMPRVIDALEQIVQDEDLDPSKSLAELGVDSLDLLEWLHVLEDEYGLRLSDETVATIDQGHSIAEIYQTLRATVADQGRTAVPTPPVDHE
jgi:acyl carrier protein